MSWLVLLGAASAAGLFVYLIAALLHAEAF